MDPIIHLSGDDLARFLLSLDLINPDRDALDFAIDGGVKIKVNGGRWSPPIGYAISPPGA